MLALAPLAPGATPLDAGERFALDLLLDLSCVLRTNAVGDFVQLRLDDGARGTPDIHSLRGPDFVRVADGELVIGRPALALVRDIAGGVAEQRSAARDRFGRVPSTENALVRAGGALEREPVISECARAIARALPRAAGRRPAFHLTPWPHGHRWAAALTHDLDVVEWWPAFTLLRLAELAKKGKGGLLLRVLAAVARTGGRGVVWRGVREVLMAEAEHDVRSTWYILCGSPTLATARAGDLTYRPESPLARRILRAIGDAGHELGLHGSFATSDEPARFAEQRERLAGLTGAGIAGVRQHYLRTKPATTPDAMRTAGFDHDSTAGFSDRNGFRLGVADVVRGWSDPRGSTLQLDEVPFTWMDRALSKYQGVERPDAWIDDALALADRCRAVQGLFVGIWHPNLTPALGFPGAPAAYARLVSTLVQREAYVAPVGELVTWRRARRRARATGIAPDGGVILNDAHPDLAIETADAAH